MKRVFYLLLFVSFLFLFIYLIRQDYIIPEIMNPVSLVLSVLLLFAGFIAQGFSWKVALDIHGHPTSMKKALISNGLSVFAKYIPGKIWVILGRAGYLSGDKKELKAKSVISLKEQLVYLWVGFLVSSIPTIIYYRIQWISLILLVVLAGLTMFLFAPGLHRWVMRLLNRSLRTELDIPVLQFREALPLILSVTLVWFCWTAGFYLFMVAFSGGILPIMMFAFPLSVSFGLIAVILPGGLGLREGIIIGYLGLVGLAIETATTISFLNRLWFIAGEVFIFLVALMLKLTDNRSRKEP
jgi:uncharacterized membrane protein YbhN (UPF0104 family)